MVATCFAVAAYEAAPAFRLRPVKTRSIDRLGRADFKTIRPFAKEGGRFFVLTIAKNADNKPKFATVVSKKVALRANVRNLIRRRLRSALREVAPKLPYSFVFTAKSRATEADYQEIRAEVSSLVVKATAGFK